MLNERKVELHPERSIVTIKLDRDSIRYSYMSKCYNLWCTNDVKVHENDIKFASRFNVDFAPKLCVECRHLERALFKGSLVFHKRKSSLTSKPIVSLYSECSPFPVYSIDEWWSDAWDELDYGITFDFSKPFFPQFAELFNKVPKMANYNESSENSDYSSYVGQAKNAYYSDVAFFVEDVFYCDNVTGNCLKLCNCLQCFQCSYLVDCAQCRTCSQSSNLWLCNNCSASHYCFDCQGCSDCILCTNLRNQRFCIRNVQYSAEEFKIEKERLINGSYSSYRACFSEWEEILEQALVRNLQQIGCEDCEGDSLSNCAQCVQCFDCMNCEDCRYCFGMQPSKMAVSCMELTSCGIGELIYNGVNMGRGNYYCRMCSSCRASNGLTYCVECFASENCFGCVGLKNRKYCIFNKQYSADDYFSLVERITQHMRTSKEWGEFFPMSMSPFAYNESFAQKLKPLSEEETLKQGFVWKKIPEVTVGNIEFVDEIPDSIFALEADQIKKAFRCKVSDRPYRVLLSEMEIYKNLGVPLPVEHPDVRMAKLRKRLRGWQLHLSYCRLCEEKVYTSITDPKQKLVCGKCYEAAIY